MESNTRLELLQIGRYGGLFLILTLQQGGYPAGYRKRDRSTYHQYYTKSIDGADTELAATVWATIEDASFITPKGHRPRGVESRTMFYGKMRGSNFSKRNLRVYYLEQIRGGGNQFREYQCITLLISSRSLGQFSLPKVHAILYNQ